MKRQVPTRVVEWVQAPLGASTRAVQCVSVATVTLAATTFWAAMLRRMESPFLVPDAANYMAIAYGDVAHVAQPWASRQLGALLARGIVRTFGGSLEHAFLVEAAAALLVFVAAVAWLLVRANAPRWMLLAIALLPLHIFLVQYLVLPDLLYAAGIAALLVMLDAGWMTAACGWMLPLMLTRESTSLTLVCFLIAAWTRLRWSQRVAAALATVAGNVIVARLAAHALENAEHLPQTVYMLLKIPWNFTRNVLGVMPWSDANHYLCTVPKWSMPLHYKSVHAVGICGFSLEPQHAFVSWMLAEYGVLPVLVAVLWWRRRMRANDSVLLRFSLIYGAVSLLLSPLLGAGIGRFIGYAWPLFVVAGPLLLREVVADPCWRGRRAVAGTGFFLAHVLLCVQVLLSRQLLPNFLLDVALWIAAVYALRIWLGQRTEPRT